LLSITNEIQYGSCGGKRQERGTISENRQELPALHTRARVCQGGFAPGWRFRRFVYCPRGAPISIPAEDPHMPDFTCTDIARMLDHSLLQPTLTDAELEKGCLL